MTETERLHTGVFGPVPETCPEHPDGCPLIEVRPGLMGRRFPPAYITPEIRRTVALWRACDRLRAAPWDGPMPAWPARLVDAWLVIQTETDDARAGTASH